MSWVYVIANDTEFDKKFNTTSDKNVDIVEEILKKREVEIEKREEFEITPDELFDDKYGEKIFDILWELKELNLSNDNLIKFKDFNNLVGDIYEYVKETSSIYYDEEDTEEEDFESEEEHY